MATYTSMIKLVDNDGCGAEMHKPKEEEKIISLSYGIAWT